MWVVQGHIHTHNCMDSALERYILDAGEWMLIETEPGLYGGWGHKQRGYSDYRTRNMRLFYKISKRILSVPIKFCELVVSV